jgi:hypothetical protein
MTAARYIASVGVMGVAMAAAALGGACSLAFPASAVQCSHDSDCTARGGAFAGSVCVDSVCVAPTVTVHDSGVTQDSGRPDSRPSDGGHPTDAGHATDASRAGDARDASDARTMPDGSGAVWSCVGSVKWPAATSAPLTVTQPYQNIITMLPVPGVTVLPCARIDPMCSTPLADAGVTNEAGLVSFGLSYGYNGYLQSTWDSGLPTLVYVNPPAYTAAPQIVAPLLALAPMQQLVTAITTGTPGGPATVNPSLGHIFIGVFDCAGNPAPGVQVSFDHTAASVVSTYFDNGLPSTTATETDSSGFFAAVNFPPGTVTTTITLASTKQVLGSTSTIVRAATITGVNVVPSPPAQ